MAHGHPDYWQYSSPQLPVPGPEQLPWGDHVLFNWPGGGGGIHLTYTVPAGRRLYIASGYVSSDSPFLNRYGVYIGIVAHILTSFDTEGFFPLAPSSLIVVEAGETVTCQVFNLDVVAHRFDAGWYGFEVTIVPGAPDPVGLGLLVEGAGV